MFIVSRASTPAAFATVLHSLQKVNKEQQRRKRGSADLSTKRHHRSELNSSVCVVFQLRSSIRTKITPIHRTQACTPTAVTFASHWGKWWERKISESRCWIYWLKVGGWGGWLEKKMDGGMKERRREWEKVEWRGGVKRRTGWGGAEGGWRKYEWKIMEWGEVGWRRGVKPRMGWRWGWWRRGWVMMMMIWVGRRD